MFWRALGLGRSDRARALSTVNNETVAVALAAGVAGMLALETRASSGVGVAVVDRMPRLGR